MVPLPASLTTAHIADACIRAGIAVRCAPAEIQAVIPGTRCAGRVVPARHACSVDVFLEALETVAVPGNVLVVDNRGRRDEACVGDLIALEAQDAGLTGIVIWGLHRDTADITAIGLPVFSAGSIPTGPLSLTARHPDALTSASVGEWTVTGADVAIADDDGVLFIPAARAEELVMRAEAIRDTERRQADRIRSGTSLRAQVRFADYLTIRPARTFREHLRAIGGAIEELRTLIARHDLHSHDLGDADALRRHPELAPDLHADRALEGLRSFLPLPALGVNVPGERRDRDDQDADLVQVVPPGAGQRALHLRLDVVPVLRHQPPRGRPRDLRGDLLSLIRHVTIQLRITVSSCR